MLGDHLDAIDAHIHNIDSLMNSDYLKYYAVIFGVNIFLYIGFFGIFIWQVNLRILKPIMALTIDIMNPEDRIKKAKASKIKWSDSSISSALEVFQRIGQKSGTHSTTM